MNAYWTLIKTDVRLAFRQRVVIFFNYVMPLAFFFIFAQAYKAQQGGAILQVVAMVTVIGVLGNGLFGAGLRTAQDREANILRRYKVAPISPLPLLVASTVTGLVIYLPYIAAMLVLARVVYRMPLPAHMGAVIVFILLGVMAMRALGLIVASVVNSVQESGIIVQVLYMSMMFLSGATFPVTLFPNWLITLTQFIPATWLMSGIQGMMLRNETLARNWQAVGAMLLTTGIGFLLAVKLFRWEKEEKMRPAARLWIAAVLLPFIVLGARQVHARDNVREIRIVGREMMRSRTMLIRDARIFVGDGSLIENGGVLVRSGKIDAVYDKDIPSPESVHAEVIEAAGKTVLPGLIDTHVHLGEPGGSYDNRRDFDAAKMMPRHLAAYLYSGVTAVLSAGDQLEAALATRELVNRGEKLGAELFIGGSPFGAEDGRGDTPDAAQGTSTPKSVAEAKQRVDALKKAGIDAIETAIHGTDTDVFRAIVTTAHADGLRVIVHTRNAHEIEQAMDAHADAIVRGSFGQLIDDADFMVMKQGGISYVPTLSAAEAMEQFASGKLDLLKRPLVQQVGPANLLKGTRDSITSPASIAARNGAGQAQIALSLGRGNLMRAYHAGVMLVTGSEAGTMLVIHGPTVQREVELWADAGIPASVALQAATLNAAKVLRADARIGSIEKGKEATMLIVDGNPLDDVRSLEAVSIVIFKGERVNRSELFKQD